MLVILLKLEQGWYFHNVAVYMEPCWMHSAHDMNSAADILASSVDQDTVLVLVGTADWAILALVDLDLATTLDSPATLIAR